ncbi:MAG: hypothetical protein P1V18_01145 [Candidatus Gracilibacteria bacterium]|nr:hypothetical protein [Candidatus Gracilibacteria bacterium]
MSSEKINNTGKREVKLSAQIEELKKVSEETSKGISGLKQELEKHQERRKEDTLLQIKSILERENQTASASSKNPDIIALNAKVDLLTQLLSSGALGGASHSLIKSLVPGINLPQRENLDANALQDLTEALRSTQSEEKINKSGTKPIQQSSSLSVRKVGSIGRTQRAENLPTQTGSILRQDERGSISTPIIGSQISRSESATKIVDEPNIDAITDRRIRTLTIIEHFYKKDGVSMEDIVWFLNFIQENILKLDQPFHLMCDEYTSKDPEGFTNLFGDDDLDEFSALVDELYEHYEVFDGHIHPKDAVKILKFNRDANDLSGKEGDCGVLFLQDIHRLISKNDVTLPSYVRAHKGNDLSLFESIASENNWRTAQKLFAILSEFLKTHIPWGRKGEHGIESSAFVEISFARKQTLSRLEELHNRFKNELGIENPFGEQSPIYVDNAQVVIVETEDFEGKISTLNDAKLRLLRSAHRKWTINDFPLSQSKPSTEVLVQLNLLYKSISGLANLYLSNNGAHSGDMKDYIEYTRDTLSNSISQLSIRSRLPEDIGGGDQNDQTDNINALIRINAFVFQLHTQSQDTQFLCTETLQIKKVFDTQ